MVTEDYFAGLIDLDNEPSSEDVARFSGLEPSGLTEFEPQWHALPSDHRQIVVTRMTELAEADVELDFQSFLALAIDDTDQVVRERAIQGLWESQDRRVIPKLTARLREDDADSVRAAAAAALGQFALLVETGKLLESDRERVYEPLMATLEDPLEEIEVRRRALESIGVFQSSEVKNWISWAYGSDNALMRQGSLFAMGRSCDPAWLPVIVSEMDNDDPAFRYEAANASREQGLEDAVPGLIRLVTDMDSQVRMAAIQALGSIGGSAARGALRRASTFEDDIADEAFKQAVGEALQVTDLEQPNFSTRPRW